MNSINWTLQTFDNLTNKELYAILKLRCEVFIVEQTCYYLDADGYDDKAVHIWAEKDGKIAAYCRIFDQGIKYPDASIGRVLTHPDFRRLGLGKILVRFAIDAIQARFRSEQIKISAQDYLLKFYSEFGFRDTGKKYLEDDIPHTEMIRNSGDEDM